MIVERNKLLNLTVIITLITNNLFNSLFMRGVIYAVAHVRGGGEKGADWHKAGTLDKKPNSWKDFHACAEWLIQNKYTSSEKIFAAGASAGGILIGRAVTDRPDLYAGADIKVGMLNALRFDYTPNFGRGTRSPEWGSVRYEEDVAGLMAMDSYFHTRPGTVRVKGKPVKAGIDPYNKLIDRVPDDNVVDL